MERVKLSETVWPDPSGEGFNDILYRLRYAQHTITPSDMLCAAEVLSAYSYLITASIPNIRKLNIIHLLQAAGKAMHHRDTKEKQ